MIDKMAQVKLSDIKSIENSRAKIGDVSDLMASIKENGLLTPLTIAPNFKPNAENKYILVAGHRRYSALTKLGLKTAPCLIRDDIKDDKELMVTNLIENIQRKDTSPYEEGRFITSLIENFKMSPKEVAIRLGVASGHVQNAIGAFKRTPAKYKDKIVQAGKGSTVPGKITLTTAMAINRLFDSGTGPNTKNKEKLYELALSGEISEVKIRDIGRLVKNGTEIDIALKKVGNTTYVKMDLAILRRQKKELEKKYDAHINTIFKKILYGEIKEKIIDITKE